MTALSIRFKRHPDDSASITCTRPDGSVTWQRQRGQLGRVFPPHDLTHFAVESVLGYRRGFYGLISSGWEISDFAKPWPRGPIPLEAMEVELIVGFLDSERRQIERWTLDEFHAHADTYVASREAVKHERVPAPPRLTQEQLDDLRATRNELLARWNAVQSGEELVLEFPIRGDAELTR